MPKSNLKSESTPDEWVSFVITEIAATYLQIYSQNTLLSSVWRKQNLKLLMN